MLVRQSLRKWNYQAPKGAQALLFHPDNPNKIWFRGGGETHWLTEDSGGTYKAVKGPAGHTGVIAIRMHPVETDWFLVMARRWACWSEDAASKRACADDLFLTQDFGKSWTNLTAKASGRILSFSDFDWGWSKTKDEHSHSPSYSKETILATVFENRAEVRRHLETHGTALAAGWDRLVDFVRSHDLFHSAHTKVVPCGNQFEIMNNRLFLAVAEQCGQAKASASSSSAQPGASGVKLKISRDYGASFADACFPTPLTERGYSVVEASAAGAAFVNVDYAQGSRAAPYGDVLVSDANLTLFSLSLRRNARSLAGAVDFAAVQGIEGVYIVNQYDDDDEDVGGRARTHAGVGTAEETAIERTTTKVTFNHGGKWETLKAPPRDSAGKPIACAARDGCSLHLHGTTSWVGGLGFAFVYSHASTPGLVISTGNVGEFLYQDSTVNTYLSRDAGQTWEEMAKGAFIYEFGDSGGVIVMAQHGVQGPTGAVRYSLDEGLSWTTLPIGGGKAGGVDAFDVFNVRVEPDNMGRKFIVQGLTHAESEGAARKGVLVGINFGEGFPEFKLCQPADYEWWTPSTSRCILGRNISMQRQARTSKCWNGDTYFRPASRSAPCACTDDDYQCDYGTELLSGRCQPILGFSPDTCPVLKSRGYAYSPTWQRLIAGDQCEGGEVRAAGKYQAAPPPGGGHGFFSAAAHFLGGVALVAALGAAVLALLAYRGLLPPGVVERLPILERLQAARGGVGFSSLSDEFGLGGDEDEHLPPGAELKARREFVRSNGWSLVN
eukprot:jgi/Mesen1/5731/ME000029S05039